MRSSAVAFLVLAGCAGAPAPGELIETFDRGMPVVVGGGTWQLEPDPDDAANQILVQRGRNENSVFNLLLFERATAQDVDLRVRLQAIAGVVDQGGGLVWRAQDLRNYYIARWNPLEENLRVYTVVDGKRTQLASLDVVCDPESWHELQVEMRGTVISCTLDGRPRLVCKDQTFEGPGRVGVWTKADAETAFDDLLLKAPSR